jgi:hypothetical protein
MLYQHEKPCFQRKQTRVEPFLPITISHLQCFPFDGLRVPLKCTHDFANQIWNFPIPSHTFRCFMFVSSRDVYDHSFHKLTMRYSIFSKIHLSIVVPSLLQFSWARITKEEIEVSWSRGSTSPRKKIIVTLWRSLKTVVTSSLFSYLGISGSRFF